MKKCAMPDCTRGVHGAARNARWCDECRVLLNSHSTKGMAARKIRDGLPKARYRPSPRALNGPTREPELKCHLCGGQPWAREPGRYYEGSGHAGRVQIAPNWKCIGCGEGYAPEPPVNLGSAIRSSAGTCADHGRYYGAEYLGGTGTGAAKK